MKKYFLLCVTLLMIGNLVQTADPFLGILFQDPSVLEYRLTEQAKQGNLDAVDQVLGMGVDVNTTRSGGRSPLEAAAENGHKNVVLRLLKAGATAKQKAAAAAQEHGHDDIADLLYPMTKSAANQ